MIIMQSIRPLNFSIFPSHLVLLEPEHNRLIDDCNQAKSLSGAEIDAAFSSSLCLQRNLLPKAFKRISAFEKIAWLACRVHVFHYVTRFTLGNAAYKPQSPAVGNKPVEITTSINWLHVVSMPAFLVQLAPAIRALAAELHAQFRALLFS